MNKLQDAVSAACESLYGLRPEVELTRPEEQFGDFATNVALKLAKDLGQNPRAIAEALAVKIRENCENFVKSVSVAGPGFINMTLQDSELIELCTVPGDEPLRGMSVVAEYSDPNPFKALHAGHLYTSLVGDAIARLVERAGATVHRVNFGGDVGLHVGKAMWGILRELGGEHPEGLTAIAPQDRATWISGLYVQGNTAYEQDETAKAEIITINKRVYELFAANDTSSPFAQIYWTCRQWSYDGFDSLYEKLAMVPFEKYYPESAVAYKGLAMVREHTGSVYELSDGAVVFRGGDHGLFTQVFINSEGLPTYAAKDVGLIHHKHEDFAPQRSFIITDVSQKDHLAVVMTSISQYAPELVDATTHLTHGRIKFADGKKMSSRSGNALMAADVLEAVEEAGKASGRPNPSAELAAIKYAFLKVRIGGDIAYDPEESVSLEGNSGPYLQYAHARARSILAKSEAALVAPTDLTTGERSLIRKLSEYQDVIIRATTELMPHHICTYLYELCQTFNRFYEQNRVIGDEREAARLYLVSRYAETLKDGLTILGIQAPERM